MSPPRPTPDARFPSTTGCDTADPLPPSPDQLGPGDRASCSATPPSWIHRAPAIFFDDAGEITGMANHYHP
ncbi:hypothetical protein [Umezawaea sp. Da 62-37]|uniref:hypothetical protein n=1 Tax=Umezawaea sp. Da 62-37 TaxID=3075927 RepID=UPI0028F71112|nr:hypothetical protein [Umezawaea sp. Da 62-37]WNV82331.1 hypothetical protein RM788_29470 [Umezawaea sp. Da 62-37]